MPLKCQGKKIKETGSCSLGSLMGCSLGLYCYSGAKSKGYIALSVCIFCFKLGNIQRILNFVLKAKNKFF